MQSDVGIPSWAVRGAKVVCVIPEEAWDRSVIDDPLGLMRYPEEGPVYTIREVRVRFVPEYMCTMVGVLLDELRNPEISRGGSGAGEETAWAVNVFRPLPRAFAARERKIRAPELA